MFIYLSSWRNRCYLLTFSNLIISILRLLNRRIGRSVVFHCLHVFSFMGQEKNGLFEQHSIVIVQNLTFCSFRSFMFSEIISVVFLMGNHGFRLAILWDGSISVHSSDLTHGFQFCAGFMHLSCVHTAGFKGRVVQDRGNSVKQLQTSEILAFTILLLCLVTYWYLGLSAFFKRLLCRRTDICKVFQDSWKASMVASLCRNK